MKNNLYDFSYGRSYCEPSARADLCRLWMFILCHAAKNEPRKRAKGCRLWKLLPCRSSKRISEKDIFDLMYLSPFCHHERQIWGAKCVAFLVGEGLAPPV